MAARRIDSTAGRASLFCAYSKQLRHFYAVRDIGRKSGGGTSRLADRP
jgi:hypothetical protein